MAKNMRMSGKGGMINEDHSAVANLPQNVMMKPYPSVGYGMEMDMDDTISGVDKQINKDVSQFRKGMKPRKA